MQQWFTKEYLPYRCWQVEFGDSEAACTVARIARRFSEWYLEEYAVAIAGGAGKARLAVTHAETVRRNQERQVTLWVVLDGLHYTDSIALARKVAGQRLAQDEHAVTFSTLPTITDFAKPSLLEWSSSCALLRKE